MVELLSVPHFTIEKASFEKRLGNLTPEGKALVMLAYEEAEKAHNGQIRDTGARFFEHPERVAIILLDRCNITNPAPLAGALLHDVVENTPHFGRTRVIARQNIIDKFGAPVADIVIPLSKPKAEEFPGLSKEELFEKYRQQLEEASVDALLVKMPDKLHNLREVYSCSLGRQLSQVEETESFYLPLFKKVLVKYPEEGKLLIDLISFEISKWKAVISPN